MFPAPLIISLPFVGAVTLEADQFSTAPASWLFCVSSLRGVCSGVILWGLAATNTACSSSACRRALFTVFLLLLAAVEFLCQCLLPCMRKLPLLLSICGPRAEWGRPDGQAVQWLWQSLAGIPGLLCPSWLKAASGGRVLVSEAGL
jgi:hypothetical protein